MIKWFGRSKSEHPLADARKVHELIAKLPANDSSQALGEIASWLELMNHAEDLGIEPRLKNLDLLDAAARAHERRLMQEYLETPRQKKSQEHKLWTGAHGFWRELGEGYLQCLRQCDASATPAGEGGQAVPLFLARGMRALKQQLRWVLLRYENVEARIWNDMARLYQSAESRGLTEQTVAVYPGSAQGGTVKQEYLKALMLAASSPESLHPVGQDIAARLVAHFSKLFVIEDVPYAGCTHWIDLAAPKRPVRMVRDIPDVPTVRYIGAGAGLRELEQLRAHIAYTRSLPEGLDLGAHDDDVVLGLVRHLEQDWAGKTQARQHERRRVATRVTVVPGLNEIVQALEFANNDSLDFTHRQAAESWIVEDMSEGGYGAVIPAVAGDWVEVGSLIGVEGESFRDWRIGLIRRVTRNAQQQQRVGVQLLTQHGELVALSRGRQGGEASAVLIPATLAETADVDIVVPHDNWEGQDNVEMRAGDRTYALKPRLTVERGADYDLVRFRILRAPL